MDDPIAAFGAYQRRRNLSSSTILSRRQRLEQLSRWLDKPLLAATTDDLERWLHTRDLSAQTISTYVSYLAAFWAFAVRARLVDVDPTEDLIRPKVPFTMRRPWDPAEIAYAVDQADLRMRCLLLLPWAAGARCVEMSRLCGEDVDRDRAVLLLHAREGRQGPCRAVAPAGP
jgi:site-specific recombinase XerD